MRPPSLEVSTQIPQSVLETFRGKKKETSLEGLCDLKQNESLLISSLLLKYLFTFI